VNNGSKKILVVDDDPDILIAIQAMLEDEGYVVETTEKGEYAEQLQAANYPDLILLDMLLSGKDGREITRLLKNQLDTKHIPIIMLSAHPGALKETLAAGADDFLAKPFDIDTLLAKVEHYLW
jgi:DNA-binding response OmpR family regulator